MTRSKLFTALALFASAVLVACDNQPVAPKPSVVALADTAMANFSAWNTRPPVAGPDVATVTAGMIVMIDVLANDSDPDGMPLALKLVQVPSVGQAIAVGNRIAYTAPAAFDGLATFSYQVTDGAPNSIGVGTVSVTVKPRPGPAPTVKDDAASGFAGEETVIDVLANDISINGQPLVLRAVTNVVGGTARIYFNRVVFTMNKPASAAGGSFSYEVHTPGSGDGAKATARVAKTNRAPVAVRDSIFFDHGRTVALLKLLDNDSDPDGDALVLRHPGSSKCGEFLIMAGDLYFVPGQFRGQCHDEVTYAFSDASGMAGGGHPTLRIVASREPGLEARDDVYWQAGTRQIFHPLRNDTPMSDGGLGTIPMRLVGISNLIGITASEITIVGDALDIRRADDSKFELTYTVTDGYVTRTAKVSYIR